MSTENFEKNKIKQEILEVAEGSLDAFIVRYRFHRTHDLVAGRNGSGGGCSNGPS
jgi:hypothetical protein